MLVFVQLQDVFPDFSSRLGIESQGRFVKKQDFGCVHQPPRDFQPSLHTARERLDEGILFLGEFNEVQDSLKPLPANVLLQPVHPGMEIKIFPGGQLFIQGRLLEYNPDVLAHIVFILPHIETGHCGRSRCGLKQGCQHADGGGLTRTVGAQETEQFPFFHVECDVVDSGKVFELFNQIPDSDDAHEVPR